MPNQELDQETSSRISMLVDHELEVGALDSLSRQIASQPDVRAQVARYYSLGAAMRGETIDKRILGLSAAVSRALADEPTVLAPSRKPRGFGHWAPQVTGIAVAASIVGLGLVLLPQFLQQDAPFKQQAGMQVVAQVTEAAPAAPIARASRWKTLNPEVEPRMNTYLEEHSEQVAASGAPALTPYVSFVSYGSKQR